MTESKVKVFKCPKCRLHLVNQTESEINAHMVSLHGQKQYKYQANRPGRKKRASREDLEKKINELEQKFKKLSAPSRRWHPFYDSPEWRSARYRALKRQGRMCRLCKTIEGPFHVNHIKPRSKFPKLALDPNNLQVLCKACNLGKSNVDETDWRQNAAQ